jgi:hypothetical protein
VSAELIKESGLDYEDLPPETPVELANGVVIIAEVANAFETLANPSELLGAIFSDPGEVLTALTNLGADMSEEEREESQKVVVAAVVATGIAVQSAVAAAGAATQAAAAAASTSSSSSGGGSSSSKTKGGDGGAPVGREGGTKRKPVRKPRKTGKTNGKIKTSRPRRTQ